MPRIVMDTLIVGDSHSRIYSFPEVSVLLGLTMNRVARDGFFSICDKEKAGKHKNILLVCGEIDCRCHVYLQLQKGRELSEILSTLASGFVQTLKEAQEYLGKTQFLVRGVLPPLRGGNHPEMGDGNDNFEFPIRGSLEDRIQWRRQLNYNLQLFCARHGVKYVPPPVWAENADNTMKSDHSDGVIHLAWTCSEQATRDLQQILYSA